MSTKKLKIHFIGIGGIGVSALARYYLEKGAKVTGSDLVSSEITEALKKMGAKIFIGPHLARNVLAHTDLVVYSPAVPRDNPELEGAKKLRIKCQSYPEALGELTKKYFTIAVSGTHGKSTTTAMIGLLLTKAGFDPTVIVGTKVKEFGNSNYRAGKSKYLVIEACEYDESFLNYYPNIIVITNIEAEHLDYFKTFNNVLKAFKKFVKKLPKDGILIVDEAKASSPRFARLRLARVNEKKYKKTEKDAVKLRRVLKVLGEHNISNALSALAVARALKIPDKVSCQALSEYKGSWRRFEIIKILSPKPYTLISDYGHHPTQIKATLQAARDKWPDREIWCVFQPHQYQRTFYLFKDFVKVFRQAPVDKLIITDIYDVAGREEKEIKKKVNSEKLVKAINKNWVTYLPKKEIINYLKKNLRGGEMVVVMGAGDIYNLVTNLTEKRRRKKID